jgi:hypothetical protein
MVAIALQRVKAGSWKDVHGRKSPFLPCATGVQKTEQMVLVTESLVPGTSFSVASITAAVS